MQKKIIALAVAAVASGAAFAQSNVTISGNLNYQLENISGSNPANAAATNAQKTNREGRARLNENASEIKFSVTEDLGNGLKAMAVVATGIQPTDGIGSTVGTGLDGSRGGFAGRDSFIGLSGNFGTIVAGRLSVHYNAQAGIDSFGANTGLAASSLAILNGVGGTTGSLVTAGSTIAGYGVAAGGRLGSTVAYVTPSVSGFNATFGYTRPNVTQQNDGVVNSVAAQSTYLKESGWTVKANFDNGPISAFLSYLAHNDVSMANTGLVFSNAANALVGATGALTPFVGEVRGFRTGLGYSFPMGLKVGLIYDTTKTLARDTTAAATTDYNAKRSAWVIPVSWNFGAHTIGATYGKANNVTIGGTVANAAYAAGADLNQTAARYMMAGYQYAFSKRTNLSVTFARIDNDARAAYDFFSDGAMGMSSNLRGTDPTSVSMGLKHSF